MERRHSRHSSCRSNSVVFPQSSFDKGKLSVKKKLLRGSSVPGLEDVLPVEDDDDILELGGSAVASKIIKELSFLCNLHNHLYDKVSFESAEQRKAIIALSESLKALPVGTHDVLDQHKVFVAASVSEFDMPIRPASNGVSAMRSQGPSHFSILKNVSLAEDEPVPVPIDFADSLMDTSSTNHSRKVEFSTQQASFLDLDLEQSTDVTNTGSRARNIAAQFRHHDNSGTTSKPVDFASSRTVLSAEPIFQPSDFVLLPDSACRHSWDLSSFIVLLFDAIIIPFTLAWQTDESYFLLVSTWATMIFWSFDMFLSFNTGFFRNGEMELRRAAIVRHYLKTTFAFDAIALTTDWFSALSFAASNDFLSSGVSRFVKVQRAVRIVRFLRMSSIWRRLESVHAMFLSDAWQMFLQLTMTLLSVTLLLHLICCIWYAIGLHTKTNTGVSWLDMYETTPLGSVLYSDFPAIYQYTSAYNFSVVQMFVGSLQIVARNTSERIFNIVCNLFGTFFGAVITSWLSALLVSHYQHQHDFDVTMKSVRLYLRQNFITASLANRIQKQLTTRLGTRKRDVEADVEAFKLLSKSLRAEMRREVSQEGLLTSELFFLLDRIDSSLLTSLCHHIEYVSLPGGDEFFPPNMRMKMAYIVVFGELYYSVRSHSGVGESDLVSNGSRILIAERSTWISEPALMLDDWFTRGRMEARDSAELVRITPDALLAAIRRTEKLFEVIEAYRKAYKALYETVHDEVLDDMSSPIEHAMVMLSMESSARVALSRPVLELLKSREKRSFGFPTGFSSRPAKGAADLENELRSGECVLVFNRNGDPARVACVVVLHGERPDGTILVQVAKVSNGALVPKVQKPATKMRSGEDPYQAAVRVLRSLNEFGGAQGLGKCTGGEEERLAKTYGIDTRFLRSEFHVPFADSDKKPTVITSTAEVLSHSIRGALSRSMSNLSGARLLGRGNSNSVLPPGSSLDMNGIVHNFDNLLKQECYLVQQGDRRGTVYVWMTTSDFEALQRKESSELLHRWVTGMQLPEDEDFFPTNSKVSGSKSTFLQARF